MSPKRLRFYLFLFLGVVIPLGITLSGCGTSRRLPDKIMVAGVFSQSVEEPWTRVIHQALEKARGELEVAYEYHDQVPPADFEKTLRRYAEQGYEIIFGDAFSHEKTVRRVARDYPDIAFCFGSALGPTAPNFSVFDDWIHEPAYLCGLIAGSLTKSGILGVVGARPVPEVNRLINAFRRGAREVNPSVEVKAAFIDSWFAPAKARAAALDLIESGADLIYAERLGAIKACREARVPAFGNLEDQNYRGRDTVITGPVWDMGPTVKEVIEAVRDEKYVAQDLAAWSMMARGGAYLASYHSFANKLPREVQERVAARRREILDGFYRVPINEDPPCN